MVGFNGIINTEKVDFMMIKDKLIDRRKFLV